MCISVIGTQPINLMPHPDGAEKCNYLCIFPFPRREICVCFRARIFRRGTLRRKYFFFRSGQITLVRLGFFLTGNCPTAKIPRAWCFINFFIEVG